MKLFLSQLYVFSVLQNGSRAVKPWHFGNLQNCKSGNLKFWNSEIEAQSRKQTGAAEETLISGVVDSKKYVRTTERKTCKYCFSVFLKPFSFYVLISPSDPKRPFWNSWYMRETFIRLMLDSMSYTVLIGWVKGNVWSWVDCGDWLPTLSCRYGLHWHNGSVTCSVPPLGLHMRPQVRRDFQNEIDECMHIVVYPTLLRDGDRPLFDVTEEYLTTWA